jgi:hypothetical protein
VFLTQGTHQAHLQLIAGTLPGADPLAVGAARLRTLIQGSFNVAGPPIRLFVTHDSIIAAFLAAVMPEHGDTSSVWPGFLEGPVLAISGRKLQLWWRDQELELEQSAFASRERE